MSLLMKLNLDQNNRHALNGCLPLLREKLSSTEVIRILTAKNVLTADHVQILSTKQTEKEKSEVLILLIRAGDESVFDNFIAALRETNQTELVDAILAKKYDVFHSETSQKSFPLRAIKSKQPAKMYADGKEQTASHKSSRVESLYSSTLSSEIEARKNENVVDPENRKSRKPENFVYPEVSRSFFDSSKFCGIGEKFRGHTISAAIKTIRENYQREFKTYNPFSQPFAFDIETTWVPLSIKYQSIDNDQKSEQITEDYCTVINDALSKANLLVIKGKAASGKTSLLRRIAYDWATDKPQKFLHEFDLVLNIEFRYLNFTRHSQIADLVIEAAKTLLPTVDVRKLLKNCLRYSGKILLLLDGYHESLRNQCTELDMYLDGSKPISQLRFFVILSSRPDRLPFRLIRHLHVMAPECGFMNEKQQDRYIDAHFSSFKDGKTKSEIVKSNLLNSKDLRELSATPLFLAYICLVQDCLQEYTIVKLYDTIIWWMLDKYQKDHADVDVSGAFHYVHSSSRSELSDWSKLSQYQTFPLIRKLGRFAALTASLGLVEFSLKDLNKFGLSDGSLKILTSVGFLVSDCKTTESKTEITQTYVFPHKSIHEYFAALYCFLLSDINETDNYTLRDAPDRREIQGVFFFAKLMLFESKLLSQQTEYSLKLSEDELLPRTPTRDVFRLLAIDRRKSSLKQTLQLHYKSQFKKHSTLSFSPLFDIEDHWVQLTFRTGETMTRNYEDLLRESFSLSRVLQLEGEPGSGKTTLVRRIAYDWALGKNIGVDYDIVICVDKSSNQISTSILELALKHIKALSREGDYVKIARLFAHEDFLQLTKILILQDRDILQSVDADEKPSSPKFLNPNYSFDLLVTTLNQGTENVFFSGQRSVILGFDSTVQKQLFIQQAPIRFVQKSELMTSIILQRIREHEILGEMSRNPLFLLFICLFHDNLDHTGSLLELYNCMIWWMLDRYQLNNSTEYVPKLFEYSLNIDDQDSFRIIQDHFLEFPLMLKLGQLGLDFMYVNEISCNDIEKYSISDVAVAVGFLLKKEKRNESRRIETIYTFTNKGIHYFFATGAFTIWINEEPFCSHPLFTKIFFKNTFLEDNENFKMIELEKYIWNMALNQDGTIDRKAVQFFNKYESLSVDISIFNNFPHNIMSQCSAINLYLQECPNVKNLYLYSGFIFDQTSLELQTINVSNMQSLETLKIVGSNPNLLIFSSSKRASGESISALTVSEKANITNVSLEECSFDSPLCFIYTFDQLSLSSSRSTFATLILKNVRICINDSFGIRHVLFSNAKTLICNSDLKKQGETEKISEIYTILKYLDDVKEIEFFAYESFQFQDDCSFPLLCELEKCTFRLFWFSKLDTFCVTPEKFPKLKELRLYKCTFSIQAWQVIIQHVAIAPCIQILAIEQQKFYSKEYFNAFFSFLQQCSYIAEIFISIEAIFSEDRIIEILDATEVFVNLAADVASLKCLHLMRSEYQTMVTVNGENVRAAGRKRNKDFIFEDTEIEAFGNIPLDPHFEPEVLTPTTRLKILLKNAYTSPSFRKINPFSLPFEFDVENTFFSLGLSAGNTAINDHCGFLKSVFDAETNFLVIEGPAASGKTSLMRRIAFDWANKNTNLQHYDLVFLAEFRNCRSDFFETVFELAIEGTKKILESHDSQANLREAFKTINYISNRHLVLLDGYDELFPQDICRELTLFLKRGAANSEKKLLLIDVVLTTRPGYIQKHASGNPAISFANILGFNTPEKITAYLDAHFKNEPHAKESKDNVRELLTKNKSLRSIAETPLLLIFICLIYKQLRTGSLLELYYEIVWWLIDRYQQTNPEVDVPLLFGFEQINQQNQLLLIKNQFLNFPILKNLGRMAFENQTTLVFSGKDCQIYEIHDIVEQVGLMRKEERFYKEQKITNYVFLHRTMQEFFVGMVYFFWPDIENAGSIQTKMKSKTMFNALEQRKMSETEKFIWASALNKDLNLEVQTINFFGRYETLNVDISIFKQMQNRNINSVLLLNTYMKECKNVRKLVITASDMMLVEDLIDLSMLENLEEVTFLSNFLLFAPKSENLPLLTSSVNLKKIMFNYCSFQSESSFTQWIRSLEICCNSNAILELQSVIIILLAALECEKIVLSTNKTNFNSYSIFNKKMLPKLSTSYYQLLCHLPMVKEITLFAKSSSSQNKIEFPESQLQSLVLHNFCFCENATKYIELGNISYLCKIEFINCQFNIDIWKNIVMNVSQAKHIKTLWFSDLSFETVNKFEEFFALLQMCESVTELWVEFGHIWPQKHPFDATSTFRNLVVHMKQLQRITISKGAACQKNIVIDKDKVRSAVDSSKTVNFVLEIEF